MPRHVPGLETSTDPALWLGKFRELVVDKRPERRANVAERFGAEAARDGRCEFAPYKPLLLFCVLAGFETAREEPALFKVSRQKGRDARFRLEVGYPLRASPAR